MITQGMRTVDRVPIFPEGAAEKHSVSELTTSFQAYMAKGTAGKHGTTGQADVIEANVHTDSTHKDMYEKESITSANGAAQNRQVKKADANAAATAKEQPDEETLDAVREDIRQTLKDVLDMEDEELDALLTAMNLDLLSLLQPENLQMFLTEATGTEPMELLTDSSLADLWNQLNRSMEQIVEEHGLDAMNWQSVQETTQEPLPMPTTDSADETMSQVSQQNETPDVVADTGIPAARTQEEPTANTDTQIWENGFETKEETTGIQVQVEAEANGNHQTNSGRKQQTDATLQTVAGTIVEQMTQAVDSLQEVQGSFSSDVQQAEIVKQVIEQIRISFGSDTSQLEVQLYPQHLGRVQIQVMMKNGVMTAQIHAETEMAKQAIEGQLQQLKDTFQQKNMQVEAVEVSVSTSSFQQEQQRQDTTGDSGQSQRSRRVRMNGFGMPEEELTEEETEELLEAHGASVEFTA